MGKTTNALEQVVHSFFENNKQFPQDLQKVREDHHRIIEDLFESESALISQRVNALFDGVLTFLNTTDIKEYSLVSTRLLVWGSWFPPSSSVTIWKGKVWKILGWIPVNASKQILISAMQIYTCLLYTSDAADE